MSRVFDSSQVGGNAESLITSASAVYNTLSVFTWSIWVNPKSTGGNKFGTPFVKDPATAYSPFLQFNGNATTTFTGGVASNATSASTTLNVTVPLNTWTNVVMTFNFSGDKIIHIFINGIEPSSGQTALTGSLLSDSGSGYEFGNDGFGDGWDGSLAEAALWNTVLTGGQITSVAASTTGVATIQAANLVGYWHLCGTASPEPDVSGNGNSAILSTNPPIKGIDSPGFSCSAVPVVLPFSSTDSRNFGHFPNMPRIINQTKTYDAQVSNNAAVPGIDSRAAGVPAASGTYPQNSRTPGTFGPGE